MTSSSVRRRWEKTLDARSHSGSSAGWPTVTPVDDREVVGDPEQLARACVLLDRDAVDAGREALLERGEPEEHERGARVDVPERHRPHDLGAAGERELVGLGVAVVVVLLARQDEEVRGGLEEPGLLALVGFGVHERLDRLGIVDDEDPQALAVAGVRPAPSGARDALERLARHPLAGVAANGAALLEQVVEGAHPGLLRYSHSIVAGGFDVTSSTTRLTPGISFTIRAEIVSTRSYGSRAQSAVIASSLVTARITIG